MTASLWQNIRGALTTRANATSGIPAATAYEGLKYTPTVGTSYKAYALMPTQERPSTLGQYGDTLRHGLFQISLFYPAGSGTGAAEAMADAVKSQFVPGTDLTQNSVTVRISYAERGPIQQDPDWIMVPVTVGFFLHTPTNS
jgi:hypothetical protein